eukprot:INCI7639.1.p1 GENE.INCI7639.1~~INCI7639.1.p1  ORF type:complete len:993 (+),score=180.75 INCI7639.1:145-3123(+)
MMVAAGEGSSDDDDDDGFDYVVEDDIMHVTAEEYVEVSLSNDSSNNGGLGICFAREIRPSRSENSGGSGSRTDYLADRDDADGDDDDGEEHDDDIRDVLELSGLVAHFEVVHAAPASRNQMPSETHRAAQATTTRHARASGSEQGESRGRSSASASSSSNAAFRFSSSSLARTNAVQAGRQGQSLHFDQLSDSAAVKGIYQLGAKELLRQSIRQFYLDFAPDKIRPQRVMKFSLSKLTSALGNGRPGSLGVHVASTTAVDVDKVVEAYFARREELFEKLESIYGERPVFPPLSRLAHSIYRSLRNFFSIVDPLKIGVRPSAFHANASSGSKTVDVRALAAALSSKTPAQQEKFNTVLRARYGEVPISPPLSVPEHRLYTSLRQFYQRYNPQKLRESLDAKPFVESGLMTSTRSKSGPRDLDLVRVCRDCADTPAPVPKQPYANVDARDAALRRHAEARRRARENVFRKLEQRYGDRPVYPPLTERQLLLRHSVRDFYARKAPQKLRDGSVDPAAVARFYADGKMHILFDKLQGIYGSFPTFPPPPPADYRGGNAALERGRQLSKQPPPPPPRNMHTELKNNAQGLNSPPAVQVSPIQTAFSSVVASSKTLPSYLEVRNAIQQRIGRQLTADEKTSLQQQLVAEGRRRRRQGLDMAVREATMAVALEAKAKVPPPPPPRIHQFVAYCPPQCGPGASIQIKGPDGRPLTVKVPPGVRPGSRFSVVVRCTADSPSPVDIAANTSESSGVCVFPERGREPLPRPQGNRNRAQPIPPVRLEADTVQQPQLDELAARKAPPPPPPVDVAGNEDSMSGETKPSVVVFPNVINPATDYNTERALKNHISDADEPKNSITNTKPSDANTKPSDANSGEGEVFSGGAKALIAELIASADNIGDQGPDVDTTMGPSSDDADAAADEIVGAVDENSDCGDFALLSPANESCPSPGTHWQKVDSVVDATVSISLGGDENDDEGSGSIDLDGSDDLDDETSNPFAQ